MSQELVQITQEEYNDLINDSIFLDCLKSVGVDNWDGYDEAVDEFHEHMKSYNEAE